MNSIQITTLQPAFNLFITHHSRNASSRLCVCVAQPPTNSVKLGLNYNGSLKNKWMRLQNSARSSRYTVPVCLFGDKGKSGSGNGINPWESFEKAFESVKKKLSVDEDKLDEQMRKIEERFGDDGIRGGGGGGSGGGGNFGGPDDDEGDVPDSPDEPLQVLAASIALLYVYNLIIDGEGTIVMTKDVIKLMLGMGASNRLKQIARTIEDVIEAATPESAYEDDDPYWLENAILCTPTFWDASIVPTSHSWLTNTLPEEEEDGNEVTFEINDIDGVEEVNESYLERSSSPSYNDDEDIEILKKNQNENDRLSRWKLLAEMPPDLEGGPSLEDDNNEESSGYIGIDEKNDEVETYYKESSEYSEDEDVNEDEEEEEEEEWPSDSSEDEDEDEDEAS